MPKKRSISSASAYSAAATTTQIDSSKTSVMAFRSDAEDGGVAGPSTMATPEVGLDEFVEDNTLWPNDIAQLLPSDIIARPRTARGSRFDFLKQVRLNVATVLSPSRKKLYKSADKSPNNPDEFIVDENTIIPVMWGDVVPKFDKSLHKIPLDSFNEMLTEQQHQNRKIAIPWIPNGECQHMICRLRIGRRVADKIDPRIVEIRNSYCKFMLLNNALKDNVGDNLTLADIYERYVPKDNLENDAHAMSWVGVSSDELIYVTKMRCTLKYVLFHNFGYTVYVVPDGIGWFSVTATSEMSNVEYSEHERLFNMLNVPTKMLMDVGTTQREYALEDVSGVGIVEMKNFEDDYNDGSTIVQCDEMLIAQRSLPSGKRQAIQHQQQHHNANKPSGSVVKYKKIKCK